MNAKSIWQHALKFRTNVKDQVALAKPRIAYMELEVACLFRLFHMKEEMVVLWAEQMPKTRIWYILKGNCKYINLYLQLHGCPSLSP